MTKQSNNISLGINYRFVKALSVVVCLTVDFTTLFLALNAKRHFEATLTGLFGIVLNK